MGFRCTASYWWSVGGRAIPMNALASVARSKRARRCWPSSNTISTRGAASLAPQHSWTRLEPVLDALPTARRIALDEDGVLSRDVLAGLAALPREEVGGLLTLADDVRRRASGNAAAVEVLFNAKKGGCSEDCHFCSQSARYATDVLAEPLRETREFLDAAREARDRGAAEFCIVVAVRGPSNALLERVCEATRAIRADMPEMHVAVSLGILTDAHCAQLAEAGVHKINHYLETARRHFHAICSTHSYDERWVTG